MRIGPYSFTDPSEPSRIFPTRARAAFVVLSGARGNWRVLYSGFADDLALSLACWDERHPEWVREAGGREVVRVAVHCDLRKNPEELAAIAAEIADRLRPPCNTT